MDYQHILNVQRRFFDSGATKSIAYRKEQLLKFKKVVQENESFLYEEIWKDFKKSEFDTYVTELSVLYHEIDFAIKHLKKWNRRKRVSTWIANLPGRSFIYPEPLGCSLIIGAWNYPYQLSLAPAVAALSAGCTVILKPSEIASHTSRAMAKVINSTFETEIFTVIEGGVEETTALLELNFDKIFFTGSTQVGKIVYKAAAKNLTPVTLELGGKSPAFITKDVHIELTAKRLVWAKFLNTGQTCIAPDYCMVHSTVKDEFIQAIQKEIEKAHYKPENNNYPQIINKKNFDRLVNYIDKEKTIIGGTYDRDHRFIEPTVMHEVSFEDKVMQEEIFGPILPILTYENLNDAINQVKKLPKPLSCYIFTKNQKTKMEILSKISFGGGAVNDAVMHFPEIKLPFGGVGHSGIGSYHGKAGFDTFSHNKSVLQKPFWFELNIKYPPYSVKKLKWLKKMVG